MKLEALLRALVELFGPRLSFAEATEGSQEVAILWDGGVDTTLGLAEGGPEAVAHQLLSTAHDLWLRRLGEEGIHPGAWATASPEVGREDGFLVLTLRPLAGESRRVRVPMAAQ